jgi:hypothetical protein
LIGTAMEIGEPRRTYTVEPVEDPVPRELPEEAPERERPAEAVGVGNCESASAGGVSSVRLRR